jgi:anti-sigma B factor antagonist
MDLLLATRIDEHTAVVQVSGEIDTATAPQLGELLHELIRAGEHHLVLDLERVEFLDGRGITVLVDARDAVLPHGGTVRLVAPREPVLTVFRITALTEVFPIHDSVQDAITTGRPVVALAGRAAMDACGAGRSKQCNARQF